MHDANHQAFAPSRVRQPSLMALSLDLIGGSSYVWSAKHLAHHTYPNVTEHDPDIDSLPFARFDPSAATTVGGTATSTLHLGAVLRSSPYAGSSCPTSSFLHGPRGSKRCSDEPKAARSGNADRRQGRLPALGRHDPTDLPPAASVLVFFLVTSFVASLALALVFQLSHCVVETAVRRSGRTTRRRGLVADPPDRVDGRLRQGQRPAALLRRRPEPPNRASPVLAAPPHPLPANRADRGGRRAAHGITYTYHPTLRQALRSHTRWLKLMGTTTTGHAPV